MKDKNSFFIRGFTQSAVTRLNKFGNLKAIKKISEKIPAPKKAAIKISLIKPEIRLINVNIADCVKPLMKKEFLSFIFYLKVWSFDLLGLILLEYDKYHF